MPYLSTLEMSPDKVLYKSKYTLLYFTYLQRFFLLQMEKEDRLTKLAWKMAVKTEVLCLVMVLLLYGVDLAIVRI